MKKRTFLAQLQKELEGLPEKEIKDIVGDYEEYFTEGAKHKRSEEDIIQGLGNPRRIAKNLKAEYHIAQAKQQASVKNILKAILASLSLGLFNIIIVLGPLIGIIAAIISLYALVISLGVTGIMSFFASFIIMAGQSFIFGIGIFFASLALFSASILLCIGTTYVVKYFLKALAAYLKINIRIVRGENT